MSMCLASWSLLVTSASSPADTVRQALIEQSDRWFSWLVVSSIVVGVGVCLEAPESTIALRRWFRHWRREFDIPPENERSFAIPASYLGLLLVILGVAGEEIFEGLSSNAETALRAHDEQVLADTILKAGTAKDSADAAAIDAKTAGEKSSQASASAATASILAAGARRESDSLTQEIKDAKQQSADASSKAADAVSRLTVAENNLANATQRELAAEVEVNRLKTPRSLSNADNLSRALKIFSGTEYTLLTFSDQESINLTKEIGNALDAAGWIRKEPESHSVGGIAYFTIFSDKGEDAVPSCLEVGVNVHVVSQVPIAVLKAMPFSSSPKEVQAASILRQELIPSISPSDESNVGKALEVEPYKTPTVSDGPVVVCVGKKP